MSWVRVPPKAARKSDLGVLCCLASFVCLPLLASFFLPSHLSFKNIYILGLVFGVIGGFMYMKFVLRIMCN